MKWTDNKNPDRSILIDGGSFNLLPPSGGAEAIVAAQEAANRAAHQEARRAAQQAAQQAADARRYADIDVPFVLPLTNYPLLTFGRLENGGLRITGVSPADHPMLSVGMHLINIEGTNVAYASIEDIIDPILGKLTRDRAGTREPVILTFAQARREVEVTWISQLPTLLPPIRPWRRQLVCLISFKLRETCLIWKMHEISSLRF